jgi:hypothetical protein
MEQEPSREDSGAQEGGALAGDCRAALNRRS